MQLWFNIKNEFNVIEDIMRKASNTNNMMYSPRKHDVTETDEVKMSVN